MKWISVEDELPVDGEYVLAFIDQSAIECSYSTRMGFEPITLPSHGCGCCSGDDPPVTHWTKYEPPK